MDRGVVLANVLMMMIVILLVVSAMMQLSFGRAVSVRRHRAAVDAQLINQSALNIISNCLASQSWPPATACTNVVGATVSSWSSCGGSCRQATLTITPSSGGPYTVVVEWYSDGRFVSTCTNCL